MESESRPPVVAASNALSRRLVVAGSHLHERLQPRNPDRQSTRACLLAYIRSSEQQQQQSEPETNSLIRQICLSSGTYACTNAVRRISLAFIKRLTNAYDHSFFPIMLHQKCLRRA